MKAKDKIIYSFYSPKHSVLYGSHLHFNPILYHLHLNNDEDSARRFFLQNKKIIYTFRFRCWEVFFDHFSQSLLYKFCKWSFHYFINTLVGIQSYKYRCHFFVVLVQCQRRQNINLSL